VSRKFSARSTWIRDGARIVRGFFPREWDFRLKREELLGPGHRNTASRFPSAKIADGEEGGGGVDTSVASRAEIAGADLGIGRSCGDHRRRRETVGI